MSNENNNSNVELEQQNNEHISTSTALADEQRVKVMSPSMLVFKRFIRNRLAVVGFVILAIMFLFAFVGPIFSPYSESQTFQKDVVNFKEYAVYTAVYEWAYYHETGSNMSSILTAYSTTQLQAATAEMTKLNYDAVATAAGIPEGTEYYAIKDGQYVFEIVSATGMATYNRAVGTGALTTDAVVDPTLYQTMMTYVPATYIVDGTYQFEYNGIQYMAVETKNADPATMATITSTVTLSQVKPECVASPLKIYAADQNTTLDEATTATLIKNYYSPSTTVTSGAATYSFGTLNTIGEMVVSMNGAQYASITPYILEPYKSNQFFSLGFRSSMAQAAADLVAQKLDEGEVEYTDESGNTTTYKLSRDLTDYSGKIKYNILNEGVQQLMMLTEAPSSEHILGTDKHAMDVATRLMYGGRVSLMVGFVVVFIEIIIGIVLGGIAGYFSGWIDVIIMRLIELFNCIPFYPMLMIISSILDAYDVGPNARIFLLMALLGILGWPGIARIVRGQILSLREQDFMVATEASGIPVSRRIFRHLIPNVIPLLIVNATMALGSIIITEATLSFLGIGVKFPAASWGSIINQAQSAFDLESYPWIWIPAGILILLTVLGFNFVGDGLRDAFDPKMKR